MFLRGPWILGRVHDFKGGGVMPHRHIRDGIVWVAREVPPNSLPAGEQSGASLADCLMAYGVHLGPVPPVGYKRPPLPVCM